MTLDEAKEFRRQLTDAGWPMWKDQNYPYLPPFNSLAYVKGHVNLEMNPVTVNSGHYFRTGYN